MINFVKSMAGMACGLALMSALVVVPAAPAVAQPRTLPDFTDLVEQVGPSVVNIRTLERVSARGAAGSGNPSDEEMQELFRRFFGVPLPGPNTPRQQRPNRPQQEEEQPRGVGSGFAVVKIEAAGLPAVRIGDVSRLKVGEWVMAIGSPFGLDNSVTAGIVSAKQRDTGDYLPFIQTDVAINPGNSGGPLINMRGEVVGINSQIYSRSGGFMGISFAIPIDEAVRVSDQLRANGRVQRGRLGVQIDQVSKEVAESIGLSRPQGALVRNVESGSPAEKAGLEAGDIILKFDGKTIEKSADLPRLVGNTRPGTRSTLTVWRRGAQRELSIVVGEFEPDRPAAKAAAPDKPAAAVAVAPLGLTLSDLTEAQKRELKLRGGVRVESATEAAARAGLREGDVILAVANVEVESVKAFEATLARLDKSKPVNVLFRRGDWAQYVLIRPAK